MNIRRKILALCYLSLFSCYTVAYSQSDNPTHLKTPFQSLESLSNALIKKDSIEIKKIVTEQGYDDIKSRNLYTYGNKWIAMLQKNKISVISDSNNLQILAIGQEDYLLAFKMDEGSKNWKFTGFITEQ